MSVRLRRGALADKVENVGGFLVMTCTDVFLAGRSCALASFRNVPENVSCVSLEIDR